MTIDGSDARDFDDAVWAEPDADPANPGGWRLVVAIAAFIVTREAGRIARNPPPALFDFEDAYEWVLEHLPDDVAATLDGIVAAGGEVVEPISGQAPELVATFRDPAGNVLGVGQQ